MTRNQIQPVNNHSSNHNNQLTQRLRARSLWGQFWMVVLQPGVFFRSLPLMGETRQWLWISALILAAVGLSAVSYANKTSPASATRPDVFDNSEFPAIDLGLGGDGSFVAPTPNTNTGAALTDGSSSVNANWTTALIAASEVVLGWLILVALLCEVSLFNGKSPHLGYNLQIAIWASVPIGLMAVLQLVYISAGGQTGESGLAGLLAEWPVYGEMPVFVKSAVLSLASRLTLFWLWRLVLIYSGARWVLAGKWWSSLLIVLVWAVVLVVAPVVTGHIRAPEPVTPLSNPIFPDSDLPPFLQNQNSAAEPSSENDPFARMAEATAAAATTETE